MIVWTRCSSWWTWRPPAVARPGGIRWGCGSGSRLAGALLGEPRILILDEPANGLDPLGIRWLRDFLQRFAARGNAVLVSSHQLSEMQQMADEAVVIHQGRLLRQASLAELTAGGTRTLEDAFLDMTDGKGIR